MDLIDFARYVGALALVLGLVGLAALAAKRYGIPGLAMTPKDGRRLSISESLAVDAKHKLFLFKRDGVEHLVLVGPEGSTVVEQGIDAPALAKIHALIESDAA